MTKKKNKSLKLELVTTCDYAMVSREGKLSILGIFETITPKSIPARHGQMYLVATIKGEPYSEHEIEFEIIDPLGKKIGGSKTKSKFGGNGKTNFVNSIPGMPIERAGKYTFVLKVDGKKLGAAEVTVIALGDKSGRSRSKRSGRLPN